MKYKTEEERRAGRLRSKKKDYLKHREYYRQYYKKYRLKNKKRLQEQQRKWREDNRAHLCAYFQAYYSLNKKYIYRRAAEYRKSPDGRKLLLKMYYQNLKKHPNRVRASQLVVAAVRDGRLQRQPCAVCGDPKVEGHHSDYRRKLHVIWLCFKHHRELHKLKRSKNAKGLLLSE